jgi:hypothetical protein
LPDQLHAAIIGAGGEILGDDLYRMPGTPDVFVVLERTNKGALSGVSFDVPITSAPKSDHALAFLPPIALKREDHSDVAAKQKRVLREVQTDDASFDREVFVDSPARPTEVHAVLASPTFRQSVRGALDLGVVSIELVNGRRSRLRLDPGRLTQAQSVVAVAAHARACHAALPPFRTTAWRPRFGPAGLISPATMLAIFPGILGATTASDYWETVDSKLALHAAIASLLPYAVLVVVTRWRARRSSAGVFRFWSVVVAGLFAVPCWTITAGYALNATLDPSLALREVEVDKKYETRSGRSTFLHVKLRPWPPLTEPVVLGVQRDAYDLAPKRGRMWARIGDGWLGYPWVDDLAPPPG